jgi:serine/threonine protein kinase
VAASSAASLSPRRHSKSPHTASRLAASVSDGFCENSHRPVKSTRLELVKAGSPDIRSVSLHELSVPYMLTPDRRMLPSVPRMADKDDLSGRKIGEFVLRERIGEGGFGAVYSCHQPLLGREAVIKVLHRRLRRRDTIVQRFLREAQLASRLDHPYAAHVYAFGIEEQDKLLWIAMERVHGVTLAQWLTTHGPMPLPQFVPFFERIASVVQTAHECGILHRDLKPSNVMVLERSATRRHSRAAASAHLGDR